MLAFVSPAELLISKLKFSKKSFRNTIRIANGLDPDQTYCFIGPSFAKIISSNKLNTKTSGLVRIQDFGLSF